MRKWQTLTVASAVPIGQRISEWRRFRGISQVELAQRLQLNPSSVCRWEKGDNDPTSENIEAVAAALDLTMVEFYGSPPVESKAS